MSGIIENGGRKHYGVGYPSHQPQDTYNGDEGRETATRTLLVEYDGSNNSWYTHVPSLDFPHPVRGWLAFKRYDLRQKSGSTADLVLSYEQIDFSTNPADIPELPVTETVENTGIIEIDITRHPKFDTPNPEWNDNSLRDFYNPREQRMFMGPTVPDNYLDEDGVTKANENAGETVPLEIRGQSKYVVGTGSVTVREYFYNEPANVIPIAGKRAVPAEYSGTADFWLIMGGSRGQDGAFWYLDLTYQYSARPISAWVYDDIPSD